MSAHHRRHEKGGDAHRSYPGVYPAGPQRERQASYYYLITAKTDKRVNPKDFCCAHGTRPFTFASPKEVLELELLELIPGSVTPLRLLTDEDHRVAFFLERDFPLLPDHIGVHPNDNTATIWLSAQAMVKLLQENGTTPEITELNNRPKRSFES